MSGCFGEMEECQQDSQSSEGHTEENIQPSGQSLLSAGGQHQEKVQEGSSEDESSSDLETDNTSTPRYHLSCAERYLQACQKTGVIPVSSFLRNLGKSTLNLNHYVLGPLGAKALAVVLQDDIVVTHLELKDNSLQAEGTDYLMEMLKENNTIQSLNLSRNQLGLKGVRILAKLLLDDCNIKSLQLSGNDLDNSAAECLGEALRGDFVLKELDLSHNRICEKGGEHLSHMLANNIGIEVLNLSWNQLCLSGASALSAALKVNSTLKELHLSHNSFGRTQAALLGEALKQNNMLKLLDVSSNRIDDEAVALLCRGLTANNSLKVLKLSQNPMTNIGALTLLKTVKNSKNSVLEEIDISSVIVYETFVELLEEARQNGSVLDIQYSVFSSVTRNLSAFHIFKEVLENKHGSIRDFFQALDEEKTMKVSTSVFRKAVKEANIPLDQRQLEWLIRKFDKNCTAAISYSCLSVLQSVLLSFSVAHEET